MKQIFGARSFGRGGSCYLFLFLFNRDLNSFGRGPDKFLVFSSLCSPVVGGDSAASGGFVRRCLTTRGFGIDSAVGVSVGGGTGVGSTAGFAGRLGMGVAGV